MDIVVDEIQLQWWKQLKFVNILSFLHLESQSIKNKVGLWQQNGSSFEF